jgi:hypothetical protein
VNRAFDYLFTVARVNDSGKWERVRLNAYQYRLLAKALEKGGRVGVADHFEPRVGVQAAEAIEHFVEQGGAIAAPKKRVDPRLKDAIFFIRPEETGDQAAPPSEADLAVLLDLAKLFRGPGAKRGIDVQPALPAY